MQDKRIRDCWWYPELPELPEEIEKAEMMAEADCSSDAIPEGAENKKGQKKIRIPVVKSMAQYLFKEYRGEMYSYMNRCLRRGDLSLITGYEVWNKSFNKENMTFPYPGVDFWRIDRENFYADVYIRLILETEYGKKIWSGTLVFWCSFEGRFHCNIEYLSAQEDREGDGYIKLSNYLVPICTSSRIDEITEQIWKEYGIKEALTNPSFRKAEKLAEKVGLRIEYHPVYDHMGVSSILFFIEDDLYLGDDKVVRKDGKIIRIIKAKKGKQIRIPANTIVINTNKIRQEYSGFNIYHEIIHYLLHYMFFRLQELTTNDPRKIETIEITEEEYNKNHDPIFFAEKQADRGAFGLMMPAGDTRNRAGRLLGYEWADGTYKNAGDLFERVGKKLSWELSLPHFRIKSRLLQLGYYQMHGALNYVEGGLIRPFAFHRDSWDKPEQTFVIRPAEMRRVMNDNPAFKEIIDNRDYVYADGHIVKNDSRFVTKKEGELELTDEALAHVDGCCLRFSRTYVQDYPGSYIFGRMNHDPHYVKQTEFYLSDLINKEHLTPLDAQMKYKKEFPDSFKDAFGLVMTQSGDTQESMAEKLDTSERTLRRWLDDPEEKLTADFVIKASLIWELPSWISEMLLEREGKTLSERNRRHQALEYIRTVLWDQGIEEANKFLKSNGMEPLNI